MPVGGSDKPKADGETEANGEDAPEGGDASGEDFIPLILFIRETSHLEKVIGREFEAKLAEDLKVEVPFARIGKYDGNVVFNRATTPVETINRLIEKGFEYQGNKVTFDLGNDKDRDEFMRNHGRHVGKIVQKSRLRSNPRVRQEDGQAREGGQEEVPWKG